MFIFLITEWSYVTVRQKLAKTVKSLIASWDILYMPPGVKKGIMGGFFFGSGFYINSVSRYGNEKKLIAEYVKEPREKEKGIWSFTLEMGQIEIIWKIENNAPWACPRGLFFFNFLFF